MSYPSINFPSPAIIKSMDCAGLIFDESSHYIDHLAPFCSLLNIPLIVCEPSIADLARRYYPDLTLIHEDPFTLKLPGFTISCDTKPLLHAAFPGQTTKTLWLPHGNSDKGWNSPFFEALRDEDYTLVYGPKMIDFIHSSKIYPKTIQIGNFRYRYFLKHQRFYEKFTPHTDYFLYAPTWDDSNSFWRDFPHLTRALPLDKTLLIKLHPNTLRRHEAELEILQGRYAHHTNIHFLPDLPPIYPLLYRASAYIGDMSSIGYDFLTFDKPLYFLNNQPHLYLSQCGTPIDPSTFAFPTTDMHSAIRKKAYEYTFQEEARWEERIKRLL